MAFVDRSNATRNVFYVEDELVNVLLMRVLFERRPGLRLRVAASCAEARLRIAVLQPSLLLLDLRLPDGHGRALLHEFRQLPNCRGIPAVAVTAEVDFTLGGSGFDEVWTKPLKLDHVLQRLDQLLAVETDLTAAHPQLPQTGAHRAIRPIE